MDLYDYLLNGSSASDIRLENGDIVFVRPRGAEVRVTGAVVRPATYQLKGGESLADAAATDDGRNSQNPPFCCCTCEAVPSPDRTRRHVAIRDLANGFRLNASCCRCCRRAIPEFPLPP